MKRSIQWKHRLFIVAILGLAVCVLVGCSSGSNSHDIGSSSSFNNAGSSSDLANANAAVAKCDGYINANQPNEAETACANATNFSSTSAADAEQGYIGLAKLDNADGDIPGACADYQSAIDVYPTGGPAIQRLKFFQDNCK